MLSKELFTKISSEWVSLSDNGCGSAKQNADFSNTFTLWPKHEKSLSVKYHLIGLVVRRPPQEWKVPDSNPACAGIFSGSSHTSDIGTPVATLPGAWRYRVSAGTGWPSVSIL